MLQCVWSSGWIFHSCKFRVKLGCWLTLMEDRLASSLCNSTDFCQNNCNKIKSLLLFFVLHQCNKWATLVKPFLSDIHTQSSSVIVAFCCFIWWRWTSCKSCWSYKKNTTKTWLPTHTQLRKPPEHSQHQTASDKAAGAAETAAFIGPAPFDPLLLLIGATLRARCAGSCTNQAPRWGCRRKSRSG